MRPILAALLCVAWTSGAWAQASAPLVNAQAAGAGEEEGGAPGEKDYWIEVRIQHQGVSVSSKHLMTGGTQSNYVIRDAKKGVWWTCNFLPVADPERPGTVELQFNLGFSSSIAPDSKESLQMQSQVRLEEGKMSLVFESPDSRVELKVQPLPGARAVEKD